MECVSQRALETSWDVSLVWLWEMRDYIAGVNMDGVGPSRKELVKRIQESSSYLVCKAGADLGWDGLLNTRGSVCACTLVWTHFLLMVTVSHHQLRS